MLKRHRANYDLIFADPPYNFSDQQFEQIVVSCFEQDLLLEHGTLVIEHSKHTDLSAVAGFKESRRYGSSSFSFFKK